MQNKNFIKKMNKRTSHCYVKKKKWLTNLLSISTIIGIIKIGTIIALEDD